MSSSKKSHHLTGKAQGDQLPWNPHRVRDVALYTALQPALAAGAPWPDDWPTLARYQAQLDGLAQPLQTASGRRLRVVPQAIQKSEDWRQGYEPRIYLQGELQTRLENWHDFFNLLTWMTFPQAKATLNARQYALIEARAESASSSAPRSAPQDALTQFDESGVILLCAEPALADLLRTFQWKQLFWERRAEVVNSMRCFMFGHGLMERALTPHRGITGKGIILQVTPESLAQPLAEQLVAADRLLAQCLGDTQYLLHPQSLAPLPLLGFPGFTPDNVCAEYYDDRRYFRPGRTTKNSSNA